MPHFTRFATLHTPLGRMSQNTNSRNARSRSGHGCARHTQGACAGSAIGSRAGASTTARVVALDDVVRFLAARILSEAGDAPARAVFEANAHLFLSARALEAQIFEDRL